MDFREANSLSDAEIAEVLDFADTVQGWVKSVRAEAFRRALRSSGCIPGWKLSAGSSSRDWAIPPEEVPQAVSAICPDIVPKLYVQSLVSLPQAEILLKNHFKGKRGQDELWKKAFEKLTTRTPSSQQTLVRETDGRPEVRRGHEFAEIAKKATKAINEEDLL